jgi:hypothetical protein
MQNPTPMPPEHRAEIIHAMEIYDRQKALQEAEERAAAAAATK